MTEDAELLRRYAELHTNADFTEFVGRHFSFVYHAALRRTGGRADLAQDVAQYVFTAVAQNAAALSRHRVIAGWLNTTTRHAANNLLREERRRATREQEAHFMSDAPSPSADPQWHRVRQELDRVMDQLPERDREAILLRFFHGRPFAQIGTTFGLSEEAARKRVDRALERLRECLVKRGFTSTSAALGAMLAGEAALAAPVHLANSVASAALAQAASNSVSGLGALLTMSTKTTLGLTGVLALTAIGVAVYQIREARQAEAAFTLAQRDHAAQAASLAQLRRDGERADASVAEAQRALEQLRAAAQTRLAANASAPAATPSRDPVADGRKFLATSEPARSAVTGMLRNVTQRNNAHFYRLAKLTPAQMVEFENRAVANGLETLQILGPESWDIKHALPVDQVRQLFGDEIAEKLTDYRRMFSAYWVASQVARAAIDAAQPISDDQADRIAHAVANNNSDYRSGKSMTQANLKTAAQDWVAVMTAAKAALSPEQWKAAEAVFVQYRFEVEFAQARQAMMAAAPAKPKS